MESFFENAGKQNRRKRIIYILAFIVAFATLAWMTLPAITQSTHVYCGKMDHQHADSCYGETGELTCGTKAHKHSEQCYSNPKADVESENAWENSVKSADYSGDNSEVLVSVAETQLGYQESEKNYKIEDGEAKGYTRYGDWSGDRYGDWSGMFVSFCLEYAGIDEMPADADCQTWVEKLEEDDRDMYHEADSEYEPQVGDVVFFDKEAAAEVENDIEQPEKSEADQDAEIAGDGEADSAGIIVDITKDEDGNIDEIVIIEGDDEAGEVVKDIYYGDDETILGYGELPEGSAEENGDSAQDEEKQVEAAEPVDGEEAEEAVVEEETEADAKVLTEEGEDYTINVKYTDAAKFPEDVQMKASEIKGAEFDSMLEKAQEAVGDGEIGYARFFDVNFVNEEGVSVEPAEAVNVELILKDCEEVNSDNQINAVHFDGNKVEVMEASLDEMKEGTATITYEQESFSGTGIVALAAEPTALAAPAVGSIVIGEKTDNLVVGDWYIIYAYSTGTHKTGSALVATDPTKLSKMEYTHYDGNKKDVKYSGTEDVFWQYTANGFVNRNGRYLSLDNSRSSGTVYLSNNSDRGVKDYNANYDFLYNKISNTYMNKLKVSSNSNTVSAIRSNNVGEWGSDSSRIFFAKVTSSTAPVTGHDNHPMGSITGTQDSKNLVLYNIDATSGEPKPKSGVTYTVYDSNGNVVKESTSEDRYEVYFGSLPDGTYTVRQTGVPDGYVISPDETQFTVENGLATLGIFFDYKVGENGYIADKTSQVVDYINRTFQVDINAKSGLYEYAIDSKNFYLVVDQSNSMLFPSELKDTGIRVELSTRTSGSGAKLSDNDARMDAAGLDRNQVYYTIIKENTESTVLALFYDGSGWCYQDASFYAKAKMHELDPTLGEGYNVLESGKYVPYASSGGGFNAEGILDGKIVRSGQTGWNNPAGGSLSKTLGWGLDAEIGAGNSKSFKIYTGSEFNRLHDIQSAVAILGISLGQLSEHSTITLETFDSNVETCQSFSLSSVEDVRNVVDAVNGICTAGGTRQDRALQHLRGQYQGNTGHNTNHLNGATPDNTYVMLITDGAPVGASMDAVRTQATAVKNNATLITVGLSMKNVTGGSSMLRDAATNAGWCFEPTEAEGLSQDMTNVLLKMGVRIEATNKAIIRDVISDSFYPINPQTKEPLASGTMIDLSGRVIASAPADGKYGTVKYDESKKQWYVEWKNQILPIDVVNYDTSTVTTYTDDRGTVTVLDPNVAYRIDYYNGRRIAEAGVDSGNSSIDRLVYVYRNGVWGWYYHWLKQGNYDNRWESPGNRIKTTTQTNPVPVEETWHGRVYVKAKEDFIGGNTIDTNKDAHIATVYRTSGEEAPDPIRMETPTVNVRLLPFSGYETEETVFLGDETLEELNAKLQNLLNKSMFEKIKSGSGNVLNKVGATAEAGCLADSFSLGYAGMKLSESDWNLLKNGNELNKDYTYDNNSSHGAVGYFTFKLTSVGTDGKTPSMELHETASVGKDVEQYKLEVTYTAYKIVGPDNGTRPKNVHNSMYTDGIGFDNHWRGTYLGTGGWPGTGVGSGDSTSIENGKGTQTITDVHHVHVVDGRIEIVKKLDSSLVNPNADQTFTFTLNLKENGSQDAENVKLLHSDSAANAYSALGAGNDAGTSIEITVKKGQTTGTAVIEHLKRGEYTVVENVPESGIYQTNGVTVVTSDTNCVSSTDDENMTASFTMGTLADGSNVIKKYNTLTEDNSNYIAVKPNYSVCTSLAAGTSDNASFHDVTYGKAEIENSKTDKVACIPIKKIWSDGKAHKDDSVQVVLFKDGAPLRNTDGNLMALTLDKNCPVNNNYWIDYFTIPYSEEGYADYSICEVNEKITGSEYSELNDVEKAKYVPYNQNNDSYYVILDKDASVAVGDVKYVPTYSTEETVNSVKSSIKADADQKARQNKLNVVNTVTDITLSVENTQAYELPKTGGIGTKVFYILGVILVLGAGVVLVSRRRAGRR